MVLLQQQTAVTKAMMEAEEAERQPIARDLHDGVGQMMSVVKMNLYALEHAISFTSETERVSFHHTMQLVDDSCKKVRSVSHNMMDAQCIVKKGLASALREFIDKLDQSKLQIHLYTEGLDQKLDSQIEIVLYRFIKECINNVIKQSKATAVDISIIRDKEELTAIIEDNPASQ